jgi:restriction system protein
VETGKIMDSLRLFWEMMLGLAQLLWLMWPVTAFIVIMLLIRVGVYIYKSQRLAKSGIADIDKLSGKDFEQYLEIFFRKLGYQVKRTPYHGDYGADLVLRKGDEKTVVQVKRYNRSVGVKAVQEAVTSKEYYHGDKAMVVTNNYFSRQARTLAKANQVVLWDRDDLVSRLLSSKEVKSFEFASSTEGLPSERVALPPATNALAAPT